MDITQTKKNRYLFLELLYKESGGDTGLMFDMWAVGKKLSFDEDETQRIVKYLTGEHLVEPMALGGAISLTHWGIKEVEEVLENPDKATEHFLPINFINIGSMNNSTLQQATTHSIINFTIDNAKLNEIDSILSSLMSIQDNLVLSNELNQELISEIQTLEIQRKSPKPKDGIISESLKSIRTILENVTSNALTPIIVEQISKLVG